MDGRHTLQFNRLPRFWHGRWRNPTAAFLSILFLAAGYPSSAIGGYTETFQTWSATSAATWQTQSLAGAPWNVPANAVVEIAVRNARNVAELSGGVRAVGSTLDRRLTLMESEANGVTALVMHVQADASSQIQHYSGGTGYVDFVLLGYWTSGTYVERFDTFTPGANTSWEDKAFCSLGVGPAHIAEIVMTNDDPANPRDAGVRTKGSSLDRRLNLAAAVAGGVAPATMLVKADTSASANVQLYAQDNTDVDFYLVGYWSVAPNAYTELFTNVGSPSSSATWQDKDLTASGVPDSAIAEFVVLNRDTAGPYNMGVRTNGSSLARLLDLHKATFGGGNAGRMHVATDASAVIEFYHANITKSHTFYLTGYWNACDTSVSYVVTDLGAVTSSKSSLGWHINSSGHVAGFDEDSSGNPAAWYLSCGSFTSLGTLGGSYAESHGSNNSDMVVGWSHNASGKRRAFRWTSGGGMVDLGTVSSRTDSEALSVNASSEIVGTVDNFGSPPYNRLAFLYLPVGAYSLPAGMNSLGTLGGTQSVAMDISDSGRVVGGAQNASGYFRPFRWNTGTMTDLGTLGGNSVFPDHRAEAVNSSGNIAGRSYTAGGAAHAFYWNGSSMSDLGVLTGGTESWAFGLNDSNVVVGTSNVTGGAFHAFVWDGTNGLRDLNNLISGSSGWTLTRATDIDNNGYITGWGTNGSGNTRAFLLTLTCNGGGGGSAAASATLASGGGVTDDLGTFDGSAVDAQGVELAHVEVLGGNPGVALEYQVTEPLNSLDPMPEPDVGTRNGFVGGVGLLRTLKVESTSPIAGLSMTVSMNVTVDEIADVGSAPKELELYVFEKLADEAEKVWVPAGTNIGESPPTNTVGQSGFAVGGGGLVKYWAVRRGGGVFAVGKGPPADQPATQPEPTPAPRMCGAAMIGPLLLCSVVLLAARRSRRT
jgi:probable HAF family extracellular repeat protein